MLRSIKNLLQFALLGTTLLFTSSTAGSLPDNSALLLVDTIIAAQKSITAISCKYHHQRLINAAPHSEYQGEISYKAPDDILMHFLFPADEYVQVNDSFVLIYGVKNEYGIKYQKKNLSPAEAQIAEQIGQIRMNLLSSMRNGYYFSMLDSGNPSNITVAATPKNGFKALGKITISLDYTKMVMNSIAMYSKEGPLVSSTTYSDFVKAADGAFFPRSMVTILNMGDIQQKDIITYSRCNFAPVFGEHHFAVPVSKKAKIVDNSESGK